MAWRRLDRLAQQVQLRLAAARLHQAPCSMAPLDVSSDALMRLMLTSIRYCRDVGPVFCDTPWTIATRYNSSRFSTDTIFELHKVHGFRTATMFRSTRRDYAFHVSWAELTEECTYKIQDGDDMAVREQKIVVKSYTVILRAQRLILIPND